MRKVILIIFSLLLFFLTAHNTYAQTESPFNPLRNFLKILFSFNPGQPGSPPPPPGPTLPITPGTIPPIDTNLDRYFPNPLGPVSPNLDSYTRTAVSACFAKKTLYEQASGYTGMAWQILAGIHYLEAGCSDRSLVSGRAIGSVEPDLAGECSSGLSGPGIPIPVPGGCGMASLLDSAIYAGKHLQGKIGKNPENYQELVIAFGRYNGYGNQNCGRTPYTSCPPYFESEDHIYPLNWLDCPRHCTMYLVYCADHVKCNPPVVFQRPGALTILRILDGRL